MLEYLAIMGLGVAAGVLTGVIPGIHPNTVVFTTLPLYFSLDIGLLAYISFVSGISVSHTFHDFLPAIFLGAPEPESALSSLPGARMAMKGRGLEAFDYTVLGGLFSICVLVAFSPFLLLFLDGIYSFLEGFMGYVLMFFLFFLVLRSGGTSAIVVAALSGMLGALSFSMPVNQKFVLVPVFAGLFAVPPVIRAMRSRRELPPQHSSNIPVSRCFRGGATGFLAGFMAGVFPGIGAAVSTSFLSPLMSSKKEFLAGMGGVNTSDIVMSFIALQLLGKARSGASVALESLSGFQLPDAVFLSGISILAVSVSVPLSFRTSRIFCRELKNRDFGKLLILVVAALVVSSLLLTGLPGLLILATSSVIGYAAMLEDQRASCMAVLLVPAILFYTGVSFI